MPAACPEARSTGSRRTAPTSPLAALRVQLEVAQAHPTTVQLSGLLRELALDVTRLGQLVDDLLVLARTEAGPGHRTVVVDLRDLTVATGDQVQVLAEPVALGRLVANLVRHAQRYGQTVHLTCRRDGDTAVLDVDDDGPGIPTADRERVFDRWVHLDAARSRTNGGAGLGLSLAREIAHRHGGDLTVQQSPLGGARLRLRLPAVSREPVGA